MSSDPLTSLWGESLASLSAVPGSNVAQRMTVTSGLKCSGLLRKPGPVGCLSRTFLLSSAWRSTWLRLTWKAKATKSGRLYFLLVPQVRRISECAPSLWRTPQAEDHKSGRQQQGYQLNLTHQVLWPTPVARDKKRPGPGSKQRHLSNVVRLWPTPTVIDSGSGRVNRSRSQNARERPTLALMARKALWPTPTANDARNLTLPPSQQERDGLAGTP